MAFCIIVRSLCSYDYDLYVDTKWSIDGLMVSCDVISIFILLSPSENIENVIQDNDKSSFIFSTSINIYIIKVRTVMPEELSAQYCSDVIVLFWTLKPLTTKPAGNYMFKVNNRNTRTRCEICSKLTIKTSERRHWRFPECSSSREFSKEVKTWHLKICSKVSITIADLHIEDVQIQWCWSNIFVLDREHSSLTTDSTVFLQVWKRYYFTMK